MPNSSQIYPGKFFIHGNIFHGDIKENVSGCFFSEHSVEARRPAHFDHSFQGDEHRTEKFADRQKMKETCEVENVAHGEQTLTDVHRVPRVPVIPVCSAYIIVTTAIGGSVV